MCIEIGPHHYPYGMNQRRKKKYCKKERINLKDQIKKYLYILKTNWHYLIYRPPNALIDIILSTDYPR